MDEVIALRSCKGCIHVLVCRYRCSVGGKNCTHKLLSKDVRTLSSGRCGECAYWDKNTGECANAADTEVAYHKYTDPDFFCGEFKPKGGE